jgi:hypothetical protein
MSRRGMAFHISPLINPPLFSRPATAGLGSESGSAPKEGEGGEAGGQAGGGNAGTATGTASATVAIRAPAARGDDQDR